MKFNEWLNSSPNVISMHDSWLACFEINKQFSGDYIMFRWAAHFYLCEVYDELAEIGQKISDKDFLLIDQVFYKPQITQYLSSSGLNSVDMEVAGNHFNDGVFKMFARDRGERYLSMDFTFEKFLTRVYKGVTQEEYYDKNNEYDIAYDIGQFSLQDFEQGIGYMNVDNIEVED